MSKTIELDGTPHKLIDSIELPTESGAMEDAIVRTIHKTTHAKTGAQPMSMLSPIEREALTTHDTDTLQAFYANAEYTGRRCRGYEKTERNEALAEEYRDELKRRGVAPDGRPGAFNGGGAS